VKCRMEQKKMKEEGLSGFRRRVGGGSTCKAAAVVRGSLAAWLVRHGGFSWRFQGHVNRKAARNASIAHGFRRFARLPPCLAVSVGGGCQRGSSLGHSDE